MARIASINVSDHAHTVIALTQIHGLGKSTSQKICERTKINPEKKIRDLSEAEMACLREEVSKFTLEGDLRRQVNLNIKRLQDFGSYRGIRHRRRLPVRGQRTKTNARTRKGKLRVRVSK